MSLVVILYVRKRILYKIIYRVLNEYYLDKQKVFFQDAICSVLQNHIQLSLESFTLAMRHSAIAALYVAATKKYHWKSR